MSAFGNVRYKVIPTSILLSLLSRFFLEGYAIDVYYSSDKKQVNRLTHKLISQKFRISLFLSALAHKQEKIRSEIAVTAWFWSKCSGGGWMRRYKKGQSHWKIGSTAPIIDLRLFIYIEACSLCFGSEINCQSIMPMLCFANAYCPFRAELGTEEAKKRPN